VLFGSSGLLHVFVRTERKCVNYESNIMCYRTTLVTVVTSHLGCMGKWL